MGSRSGSTLYRSFKTHPSQKHTSLKFDSCTFQTTQLKGYQKSWTKGIQDLQAVKINKTYLISLILIEAEEAVPEIIPLIREVEEILDHGHMMETDEGFLHSEADSEAIIIEEGPTEDKTTIEIESAIDVLIVENLVILPKSVLRSTNLQIKCSIEKEEDTKGDPSYMKVIQKNKMMKKKLWQQCITVVKLTAPSK